MDKFRRTALSKLENKNQYKYRYGAALVFVLYTGLREGEALALQYKHLDLRNKKVTIEQNLVMVTDGRRQQAQRTIDTEVYKNIFGETRDSVVRNRL